VVVDETVAVVVAEDGESATVVIDEVITDAAGDVEEVVLVEEIELDAESSEEPATDADTVVEDEA
jgi:hypothetical protein